jgi:hypothetical protein
MHFILYPDSVISNVIHNTPMIDWLGVTGLGVGGIEPRQPYYLMEASEPIRGKKLHIFMLCMADSDQAIGLNNWTKFGIVFIILLNLTYL